MVSKELLSEVLSLGLEYVSHNIIDNEVCFTFEQNDPQYGFTLDESINIHELAHKCKEWAYDNGYVIDSGVHPDSLPNKREYFYTIHSEKLLKNTCKSSEIISTEPEAIFKACEWLLKEIKS